MERLAAAMITSAFTIAAVIGSGGSIPLFARGVIMAMTGSPPMACAAAASDLIDRGAGPRIDDDEHALAGLAPPCNPR